MCGIAGILEFDAGSSPGRDVLQGMADTIVHRGPDADGFYCDGPVGLAHRRLSIIDIVGGRQPMGTPDGQVWVVFNGEIYNHREMRETLERRGHVFRSHSDTEVLLGAYVEYGLDVFQRLNGMFACAFWDKRLQRLVLARDRFGKKPLFYYQDRRRFVFGSEIKALLAHGGICRTVNPAAIHDYLSHSFITGEHSPIEGVRRLAPAHMLVVERDGRAMHRPYWELPVSVEPGPENFVDVQHRLETLLRGAVRRRLMSDVPLGAFLSGGLDSSMVVAMMVQESDRPVQTFSIGFKEAEYSEVEDARIVAHHLGTTHEELIVDPSAVDVLPELVWYLDEPFGDSSAVPTYYVCREARKLVTVALSGDGGDEVFAGYTRYQTLNRRHRWLRPPAWLRERVRATAAALPLAFPGRNRLHALACTDDKGLHAGLGMYPYVQGKLYEPAFQELVSTGDPHAPARKILDRARPLDPVSTYQYWDMLEYLPADILVKVDRMSMANALEVRSPLLDQELVAYMAGLPVHYKLCNGTSKYVLRELAAKFLPAQVLGKRKQGFAIPKDRWFRRELRGMAHDIILSPQATSRGYFRRDALERVLREHDAGRRDYSLWIWCLVVLEMWHRIFIDQDLSHRHSPQDVQAIVGR